MEFINHYQQWHDTTVYKKSYHVAQKASNASDENDGSALHPFLTVNRAAQILQPGEEVIVHEGLYREAVRPLFGGTDEAHMIRYRAAEGENVEITGGEMLNSANWVDSVGWRKAPTRTHRNEFQFDNKIYMTKLPRNAFIGINPFAVPNGPNYEWYGSKPKSFATKSPQFEIASQKCGLLFCDGKRMEQVFYYWEMDGKENTFFVEGDGLTIHVHVAGNDHPANHCWEFTARDQCFCPDNLFVSYLHVEGIKFTKAGNGFPPPQRGAVSVNLGHHWIIERCEVHEVNGAGIDIGFQCPPRYADAQRGFQQVINCLITDCGIAGICGTCGGSSEYHYLDMQQPEVYVAHNRLDNCCFHNFAALWENSAIKLHHLKKGVIAENYITNIPHGMGIWLDASNSDCCISGNVIINTCNEFGSIFLEASVYPNNMDHNIVVGSYYDKECITERGGSGLYSHVSDEVKINRNIALGCEYAGIRMNLLSSERVSQGHRGATGFGMEYFENLISDCDAAILTPRERVLADKNIYGKMNDDGYLEIKYPLLRLDLEAWRKYLNCDCNGRSADIQYRVENDALYLTVDGKETVFDFKQPIMEQMEAFWNQQ